MPESAPRKVPMKSEQSPADRELSRIDAEIERLFAERREVLALTGDREAPAERIHGVPCDGTALALPMSVTKFSVGQLVPRRVMPRLVRVRRLGKGEKTYAGIYVADVASGVYLQHVPRTGHLRVEIDMPVPLIAVPALGEMVLGTECWWAALADGEEFTELSDLDVARSWHALWNAALDASIDEGSVLR
jgi:hypothetical protein